VLLHAMEVGLIQIFVRAGAHIGPPSHRYTDQCHFQGISKGEVCLSTSGRFYSADEIGEDKEIIYCNPEVAAVSAVLGFISDPYEIVFGQPKRLRASVQARFIFVWILGGYISSYGAIGWFLTCQVPQQPNPCPLDYVLQLLQ